MVFEWLKSIFRRKVKEPVKPVVKHRKKIRRLVKLGKVRKVEKRKVLVSELMTRKIISVSPSSTLDKVADLFLSKNISGAPVLDRKFFIGEISKTDILNLLKKDTLEGLTEDERSMLSKIKVSDVMKKPICIYQHETIEEAEKKMDKFKIKRLLVLDKRKNLVGIITRTDLLRGKSKEEIKQKVFTKVDEMVTILEKEGKKTFKELSTKLNVPESLIEEWCKVLEEHGLVEVEYPVVGNPSVKIKAKL
jgi:CBS domain-containing protein